MILSNDNLLFDIQGINGEEARKSAISDVMDSLDRLFQPENAFWHSETPDPSLQSESPTENMESIAPVYHQEISADDLKSFDNFPQSETEFEDLKSFSHQFQSKNSIKNGPSYASQASSEIIVKNGPDPLIELLTLESQKARAKVCLRCNRSNQTKSKRCKYCGARITPPFIETKLKKLDGFLRKIFFPYN